MNAIHRRQGRIPRQHSPIFDRHRPAIYQTVEGRGWHVDPAANRSRGDFAVDYRKASIHPRCYLSTSRP